MPNEADRISELERQVAELREKNVAIAKWAQELGPLLARLGDMLGRLESRIEILEQANAPTEIREPDIG